LLKRYETDIHFDVSSVLDIIISLDDSFLIRGKWCQRGLLKMGRNKEHAEIGKLVNEIVSATGHSTELGIKFEIANEAAKKILKEAEATIAKQKSQQELP